MSKRDYLDLSELFDDIFAQLDGAFVGGNPFVSFRNDFRNICSSAFPPVNVILKKNKDLVFELAIAGYKEEDVSLTFEGDKMFLTLQKKETQVEEGDYAIRGIKNANVNNWYFVPASRYNTKDATAKLVDGILTVTVPAKEPSNPQKILINKS